MVLVVRAEVLGVPDWGLRVYCEVLMDLIYCRGSSSGVGF